MAAPEKEDNGTKDTLLADWFSVHVPSPVTVSDVCEQPVVLPVVWVSPAPHSRNVELSSATEPCWV